MQLFSFYNLFVPNYIVTFSNNSLTKIETSNGRNNNNNSIMRPRSSRSVHTTTSSYLSNDDLLSSTSTPPLRDLGRYEGSGGPNQWPFYVPKPIIVKNYYPEELTVGFCFSFLLCFSLFHTT